MNLPAEVHLDIPFYTNNGDGNQCQLVCAQTAIKRHTGEEVSLAKLDRQIGRTKDQWVFTQQTALALRKNGCNATYYSRTPLSAFLEGEPFMRQQYGADWKTIAPKVNVPAIVTATKEILEHNCFEQKLFTENDFKRELAEGNTVFVCLDHNTLIGQTGNYAGHAVVLVGYTPTTIIYHENGPKGARPNVSVPSTQFFAAWNHPATDNDVVVIRGTA